MKNKMKLIILLLLLINCNAFAQKGHSINSNSIIRQLPRINHPINPNVQNHTNKSVFGNQKNHSNNQPRNETVKDAPKERSKNKNDQGSNSNKKTKKGK